MAYYIRRKTVAYDNISNGGASGKERTIAGNAGTTEWFYEKPTTAAAPSSDIPEKYGNANGNTTPLTGTSVYIVEKI